MGRRRSIFSLFNPPKKRRTLSLFPKKRRTNIFGSRKSNPLNDITRFINALVKLFKVFTRVKK